MQEETTTTTKKKFLNKNQIPGFHDFFLLLLFDLNLRCGMFLKIFFDVHATVIQNKQEKKEQNIK